MFLAIAVILFCTPFIWWFLFLQKYKSLSVIPGPRPIPLLGNANDLGQTPQAFFNNCSKFMKEYGDVFRLYIADECKIFVANADFLEQIMSSNVHITKSRGYSLLKKFVNYGLLTSTGSKWKTRRKMITPTFHFKILDQFLEVFNASGDILVDKLSQEVGKPSTDLYPYINLFSLDVICETAMGVKMSTQEGENSEFVDSLRGWLDIFMVRFFSAWKRYDSLFKITSEHSLNEHYLNVLQKYSSTVVERRRSEKAQEKKEVTDSDFGIKRKVALLDMLLESEYNQSLTNDDITEEINTFMFEGHDTTTSGICFALLALADHPEVQDRVYEEIEATVGDEKYVTMKQLQDTRYLEMVVKEVQRKYSAVPIVERQLEVDAKICGVDFPKDTTLTLYLYGVHQNEKYFPEPEKFDPDRFLPERQSERHNYAFVPFSAGARNCIGQKFAMLDMKVTLIKILQKYKVSPVPGYKPELGMAAILKSYNGINVRFQRRSHEMK
ncbi:hypothetical protein Zmor_018025 [Zophobas morio]|uniref:Cytochrome P450 n=1 Tax=Zophobas morio TaxID=2755281 RepID=A0AA38IB80_9CUCU|nr:hypothetical protein Zmor_018025 [Zophobas morio]